MLRVISVVEFSSTSLFAKQVVCLFIESIRCSDFLNVETTCDTSVKFGLYTPHHRLIHCINFEVWNPAIVMHETVSLHSFYCQLDDAFHSSLRVKRNLAFSAGVINVGRYLPHILKFTLFEYRIICTAIMLS